MSTPSISVIIPAYNQAAYLAQCIRSVLEQTYGDFELVVVDDGSTDHTPHILASFQDPRLRVIRQPNAGLSAARNTGLRESTAPYVTFLDSDDYFLPDKLEVLSGYMAHHPTFGLVVGRTVYIDETGKTIAEQTDLTQKLALPDMLLDNPICVSGILMKREWLTRTGTFDEELRACEDWDLWLRLLSAGCQMAWVDHPVVAYRFHGSQMTRQSQRMRKAIFATLDKFFSQPDLPAEVGAHKHTAYAAAHVHAAAYAYLAAEVDQAALDLAEAIRLDATLKQDNYKRLTDWLVGWSHDPRCAEPVSFLQLIASHPPPGQPGFIVHLQRAIADEMLGALFKSSRQTWRARRSDLLRVIFYKPEWLLNRGVIRMIKEAWSPF